MSLQTNRNCRHLSGPSQSKNPRNVLAVRSVPIQSRRLFPWSSWYTRVTNLFLHFRQQISSVPIAVIPLRSRCSSPHATAIFTERKTLSQLVLNAPATSFQLNRLAQVARNQA